MKNCFIEAKRGKRLAILEMRTEKTMDLRRMRAGWTNRKEEASKQMANIIPDKQEKPDLL
jgi:hypothetical protein